MTNNEDQALREAHLEGAWVEVDLGAIASNAAALASLCGPRVGLAPVVKANAYGHGAVRVARTLEEHGFKTLCVARVSEGRELRAAGIATRVIVLYEPSPPAMAEAAALGLEVAVGSAAGVRAASELRSAHGDDMRVQLVIDTGMTRQGLGPEALDELGRELRTLASAVTGIWTHLRDGADAASTDGQLELFDDAVERLRALGLGGPRHAAASAAILAGQGLDYEMVRPGLALYGALPSESVAAGLMSPVPLRPAMAVRALPMRIVDVPPGTRVGYGGTFTTRRPSLLVTLPVGYGDGLRRSLGDGRSSVLAQGTRLPIVGRVSMDSCVVDASAAPDVTPETVFTILGPAEDGGITLEAMAATAGTVPQEIALGFDRRLPLLYR